VTAVDLSASSIEVARQRAEVFGLSDRIRFVQGDSEQLDRLVDAEQYDLVYSFGVIHHTPHPERVVEHIRRFMGPQSELRLMVYSRVSYKLFWIMREEDAWDMGRIDELIARNSEAQTGCPVTYSYTFDSVRELLAGFDVLDAWKAHIFTWDIEPYKRYEYVKDPAWAGVGDAELAQLEKELGWHLLVRARGGASRGWGPTAPPRPPAPPPRCSHARSSARRSRRTSSPCRRAAGSTAPSRGAAGSSCCRCCGR
jgi:SAM-dependent methyltransferase